MTSPNESTASSRDAAAAGRVERFVFADLLARELPLLASVLEAAVVRGASMSFLPSPPGGEAPAAASEEELNVDVAVVVSPWEVGSPFVFVPDFLVLRTREGARAYLGRVKPGGVVVVACGGETMDSILGDDGPSTRDDLRIVMLEEEVGAEASVLMALGVLFNYSSLLSLEEADAALERGSIRQDGTRMPEPAELSKWLHEGYRYVRSPSHRYSRCAVSIFGRGQGG